MEGVSAAIKRYLRRKDCERLKGGREKKDRWRWIKLTRRPKLKIRFLPNKLFLGLREAYLHMMMRIANNGAYGFGERPINEYDDPVIVEIYKSVLKAQGQQQIITCCRCN